MRILNEEKLVKKAAKRAQKAEKEVLKNHLVKCPCCGAKIEFNGFDIRYNKEDYDYDIESEYYILCPNCGDSIQLDGKYPKIYHEKDYLHR